jgi:hypothetical protein
MKASIIASDGNILCQGGALREGFTALGHEHVPDTDPTTSFIFVGDPPYGRYLGAKNLILNVLDLPFHAPEINDIKIRLRAQLPQAARVTAISATVAAQLKEHVGVDANVIYYPMKKVFATGKKGFPYRVAMVGRLRDPNKFSGAAIKALIAAGFNEHEVAMVGPEYPGWGANLGLLSDEALNDLYNSVDYVVMLSQFEGIGLPVVEGACCGAIPIVASHLQTRAEFWDRSPLGAHYPQLNSPAQIASLLRELEGNPTWRAQVKADMLTYANTHLRPKFDRVEVAKRIINVYQSIS